MIVLAQALTPIRPDIKENCRHAMNTFVTTRLKKTLFSKFLRNLSLAFSLCISNSTLAQNVNETIESSGLNIGKFTAKLGMQVLQVGKTPWPGMLVVMTDRGIFYTNSDATLLIQGTLYDITETPINETDKFKGAYLTKALPDMQDQWIEFTAPEQKQVLYVYTSPSCGYCKKLHREIDEYLNAGVTIRYLAMPRAGAESDEFKNMSNTWCKGNRVEKFNNMMSGDTIAPDTGCNSSLTPHLTLAQNLGINSTPAIISESGKIQMGYRPWQETITSLK